MAEMAPNPFPIVDTEPAGNTAYDDSRPRLELVEPADERLPKLTAAEAEHMLGRGPYVARLRASRRILSIATAFVEDEQTTELIGDEYLQSLRRDVWRTKSALSRYDSRKDRPGDENNAAPQQEPDTPSAELAPVPDDTTPSIGQQAVSITTEVVVGPPQGDPVLEQARLRRQAHRILIARTRPDPFSIDVRGSDATKLSKDGAEIRDDNWGSFAECRKDHPDAMFVRGAEQHKAKALCAHCDVKRECLADALENQVEWGVWGGMTERERRALLRKRNWRSIFPPKAKQATEPQVSA